MAELNIYTSASWWYMNSVKIQIEGLTKEQKIDSITLSIGKFKNPNGAFYTDGGVLIEKGAATGINTVTAYVKKDGTSSEAKTITNIATMQGSGNPPWRAYDCWAVVTNYKYTFTFSDQVLISPSSNELYVMFSGISQPSTGVSMFNEYIGHGKTKIGTIRVSDVNVGPTKISVEPNTVAITNLSGNSPNSSLGILKGPSTTADLTIVSPNNAQISSVDFPGNRNTNCSYKNGKITVKAKNNTANYGIIDEITVRTSPGSANTKFYVGFYEKPTASINGDNNLILSVNPDIISKGFSFNLPINKSKKISRNLFIDNISQGISFGDSDIGNLQNKFLNIEKTNDTNIFKVEGEKQQHSVKWRFYNSSVQTATSNNTYKTDIETNVTYYVTPNNIQQFTYSWLDTDGNLVDPPTVIIPGFNPPIIGNLSYNNNNIEDGYCRGFRIDFIDDKTKVIKKSINLNAEINAEGYTIYDDVAFKPSDLDGLDKGTYQIKITLYFYYNGAKNEIFDGVSTILTQKLIFVKESDLYPNLIFPKLEKDEPYTLMLLPRIERFGYEFPTILMDNITVFDASFGVIIYIDENNRKEINFKDTPQYFSSNTLVEHLVCDIGKYVEDNELYGTNCTITPYIDVFKNKSYTKRIFIPSVIINTDLSTLWLRPKVNQGKHITYFDYDRFIQFINKYIALSVDGKTEFDAPVNMQGVITSTSFWTGIADKLDIYAQNMQNWAANATNAVVLWTLPKFKHKKGEYITNNNLYQNYYDLLIQYSGYDIFATHEYLNNKQYTHGYLGNFTHTQIKNKEDGV